MTHHHSETLDKPLVSIALCTYNGERFLCKQLDSLLAQTHRPIEIVVTDDQSTDSTWKILNTYLARHPDLFKIYQNEHNLGYVKNFEKVVGLCTGDYIALCDQDDIWLPNKISEHLADIGDFSLTYSIPSCIDEQDNPIDTPPFKVNRLTGRCPLNLLFHTCVTGHLALVKKEVIARALPFPARVKAHDIWIPLVAAALDGIHASDKILSYYRMHSANVSRNKNTPKEYNPLKKILRRRQTIHQRLEDRISFLEEFRKTGLLKNNEAEILETLITETKQLRHSFINFKLRRFYRGQKSALFAQYKKPEKMIVRLSRGLLYYKSMLYLNRA